MPSLPSPKFGTVSAVYAIHIINNAGLDQHDRAVFWEIKHLMYRFQTEL